MELKPIEVWYWHIRGKGTVVTDLLSSMNVPFTLNSFTSMEDYQKFKTEVAKDYAYVNLPMIRDPNHGNNYLAETDAILHYLTKTYKPESGVNNLDELPEFMTLNGVVEDTLNGLFVRTIFSVKCKDVLKEKILASKPRFALKLATLENILKSKDWLFKNRFTFLDVKMGTMVEWLTTMENELKFEVLSTSQREVFIKHMKRVEQVEGIKKWRASDKFFARPFSPPTMAAWY